MGVMDWDDEPEEVAEWRSEFESMTLAELVAWPDQPDEALVAFYADQPDHRVSRA